MKTEDIDTTDWHIEKDTFSEHFAKILKKEPEKLQLFKEHTIDEYNKTKKLGAFFTQFKNNCYGARKNFRTCKTRGSR
ncbi:MAG: hypothetical protein LBT79_03120 [Elusimicrobiota bacterium]|jgi:hypothetical protein|nr:hypothetical protein [Elusimicrobiota bacterium]